MSQSGGNLRGVTFSGKLPAGQRLKRLRGSQSTAGVPTKSPAKEKEKAQPSQVVGAGLPASGTGPMPPPLQRPPLVAQDAELEAGALAAPAPGIRIPVDPQHLDKIPEAFRGTVYESASYAVNHFYKLKEKELRAIETTSPVRVIESSMDMTLTVRCSLLSNFNTCTLSHSSPKLTYPFFLAGHCCRIPRHCKDEGSARGVGCWTDCRPEGGSGRKERAGGLGGRAREDSLKESRT